jgi:uncharacterized alpha-E superfamily protein
MLSRTAENLFWLTRYVERAAFLARAIESTMCVTALPNAYIAEANEWDTLLLSAGVSTGFYETHQEADEHNALEYVVFSSANPLSIRNCIDKARFNSQSARNALTGEMWETVDGVWTELQGTWDRGARSRDEVNNCLRIVQERALRFEGAVHRTMLRNDAYWFSSLGLQLERADNTARILHVRYQPLLSHAAYEGGLLDYSQLTATLRSVSALTAYHRIYRETLKPLLIAELLILNDSLPCSLASCYRNLVRNLDQIGIAYDRQGPAQRHSRGIRNRLEHGQMEDIIQHGIAEFVQEFIADNATLAEIIAKQYMI